MPRGLAAFICAVIRHTRLQRAFRRAKTAGMLNAYDRVRRASARMLQARNFDAGGVSAAPIQLAGRAARIYRPRNAEAAPTLLYFHGGAFFSGGLDSHERLCLRLALYSGANVIAAPYGLAPRTRAPQMLDNAIASARALSAEAGDLRIDPDRIILGGDSAGGYLASRVALQPDIRAEGLLLIYPLIQLDPRTWWREMLRGGRVAGLPSVSIMAALGLSRGFPPLGDFDLSVLPPTVILAGGPLDPVSYDVPAFSGALERAEVSHRILESRRLIHGELAFLDRSPRADKALEDAAALLAALIAAR